MSTSESERELTVQYHKLRNKPEHLHWPFYLLAALLPFLFVFGVSHIAPRIEQSTQNAVQKILAEEQIHAIARADGQDVRVQGHLDIDEVEYVKDLLKDTECTTWWKPAKCPIEIIVEPVGADVDLNDLLMAKDGNSIPVKSANMSLVISKDQQGTRSEGVVPEQIYRTLQTNPDNDVSALSVVAASNINFPKHADEELPEIFEITSLMDTATIVWDWRWNIIGQAKEENRSAVEDTFSNISSTVSVDIEFYEPEMVTATTANDVEGLQEKKSETVSSQQEGENTPNGQALTQEEQECNQKFSEYLTDKVIHFESSSTRIQTSSLSMLTDLAKIAKVCDTPIIVKGFTDNEGPTAYNLYLSLMRAKAVRRALIKQGLSKDKIVAEGLGETQFIADNATVEGRRKNRRIEISVKK